MGLHNTTWGLCHKSEHNPLAKLEDRLTGICWPDNTAGSMQAKAMIPWGCEKARCNVLASLPEGPKPCLSTVTILGLEQLGGSWQLISSGSWGVSCWLSDRDHQTKSPNHLLGRHPHHRSRAFSALNRAASWPHADSPTLLAEPGPRGMGLPRAFMWFLLPPRVCGLCLSNPVRRPPSTHTAYTWLT